MSAVARLSAPAWFSPVAVALGALSGALLVGRPVGLGLTLLLWAIGGVAASCASGGATEGRRPVDKWAGAWWVAAGLLALVPTIRAAGWVVVPCVLGAGALASLAVSGGATWREVMRGALAWLRHFLPGPFVVAGVALARMTGRDWTRLTPVVRGLVVSVPVLVVFGALFAAGDAAFETLLVETGELVPHLSDDLASRIALALAVVGVSGALLLAAQGTAPQPRERRARLGPVEWTVALVALDALFALFVCVQITTFFGGHDFVQRTAGLTYAEYAREGFGDLLFAAVLTLAVIAAARSDDRRVRTALGVLCLLTLVVLASALRRIGLYEEAFGLTRERFTAHVTIFLLGSLYVALLTFGVLRRERALPRACVALTAAFGLAFAASNPDARIASFNRGLDRPLDSYYLEELSADAAPTLDRCMQAEGGPLSWNLGRSRARC